LNNTITKENAIRKTSLLFEWIIIHLNSANTKKKCMQKVKRNRPGDEEAAATLKVWWLLGLCLSVSTFFLLLCICVCFLLFLSSASSSLSLLVPALSSPLFSLAFFVFLFLFFCLLFLSLFCPASLLLLFSVFLSF